MGAVVVREGIQEEMMSALAVKEFCRLLCLEQSLLSQAVCLVVPVGHGATGKQSLAGSRSRLRGG